MLELLYALQVMMSSVITRVTIGNLTYNTVGIMCTTVTHVLSYPLQAS